MLGTDHAILVVDIKFVNTFFQYLLLIVCTGQSPAIPPLLPKEQASSPTPASPALEGKYSISFCKDLLYCR